MQEILRLEERVRNALQLGESHFREFKSAYAGAPTERNPRDPKEVAKDIAETLVAFANADGGELLVGVEDDASISGVPYREPVLEVLVRAPEQRVLRQSPLPDPLIGRVEIDGKLILYFSVEKSTKHIHLTSDGRCIQRRDRSNEPTPVERIEFERQEQRSRAYDREFVDEADVVDLDPALLEKVGTRVALAMSPEKCLQLLGVADYAAGRVRIRRAALLLFARDISHWHPRCGVRLLRVRGTQVLHDNEYNVVQDEMILGNVLQVITKTWEALRPHLIQVRRAGGLFEEQTLYPEDACLEALVNAVAHRDYSVEGRLIELFIFEDRLEVRSPGELLSTIPLTALRELKGFHESRNALLTRVLRELDYMREVGEGVRRMFRLMRTHELVPPELASEQGSFAVTLRHTSSFSEADQKWLEQFAKIPLTRDERIVVLLGRRRVPLSPQQIWDALEIVDTEDYRKVVESLQGKGLLRTMMDSELVSRRAEQLGVPRRQVARFDLREPADVERRRSEVLAGFAQLGRRDRLRGIDYETVRIGLPLDNPYRAFLSRSARLLGLVNDDHVPSAALDALWAATQGEVASAAQTQLIPPESESKYETGAEDLVDASRAGTIVLRSLPPEVTQSEIYAVVRSHGPIRFVSIPLDVVTGKRQGIALIQMRDLSAQAPAIRALRDARFRGFRVIVDWEPIGDIPSETTPH